MAITRAREIKQTFLLFNIHSQIIAFPLLRQMFISRQFIDILRQDDPESRYKISRISYTIAYS